MKRNEITAAAIYAGGLLVIGLVGWVLGWVGLAFVLAGGAVLGSVIRAG